MIRFYKNTYRNKQQSSDKAINVETNQISFLDNTDKNLSKKSMISTFKRKVESLFETNTYKFTLYFSLV